MFLNRLLHDVGLGHASGGSVERAPAALRRLDLPQEDGDVDAAVRGRERPEPPRGLLQLRSQPTRLPRPAWYQATATWTSPWKKSFSAASDARHASSSASCAAKYSPRRAARGRARGQSRPTLDLAVLDPDLVRPEPGLRGRSRSCRCAGRTSSRATGRSGSGPRRAALAERPLQVQAVALQRVELAVQVDERDRLLAGLDRGYRPGRDVFDLGDACTNSIGFRR